MSTTVWSVARFTMNDRRARTAIILAGVLCLLVFSATIFLPHSDGHLIGSDGRSYFTILRSLVFDRDFDFANEYEYVGFAPKPLTVTCRPKNPFAFGKTIMVTYNYSKDEAIPIPDRLGDLLHAFLVVWTEAQDH